MSKGFTLIEMVVAGSVFAVLSIVSYTAINSVLDSRESINDKRNDIVALQRTHSLLKNDLRYAVARGVKDEFGEPKNALLIEKNGELIMLTAQYPTLGTQSDLKRVAWELKDNSLWRYHFEVLDRVEGTKIFEREILKEVAQVNIYTHSLRGSTGVIQEKIRKSAAWEFLNDKDAMPLALEVEIEMDDEKTYNWIFEVPGT